MMKRISVVLLLAGLFTASAVQAKKPECIEPPGHGGDRGHPEKVTLLHCGCADTGDGMYYVEIQVSSKSRGHLKHLAGGIDCYGAVGFGRLSVWLEKISGIPGAFHRPGNRHAKRA